MTRVAGVFVGVSRQADGGLDALSFGHRDAQHLHSLFADANAAVGADPSLLHLLTDEQATADAVRHALRQARDSVTGGGAEYLVAHFACHGTHTGALLLYDADRDRVEETTLPLHEVADLVASVPEASVVITLDCCFSGTFVGQPDSPNREAFDRWSRVVAGEGRFVAWASGPDERAYESLSFAHGYLSYGLIHAMAQRQAAGHASVTVSDWLAGAIEIAQDQATRAGKPQRPGGVLRLGSAPRLRVPPIGPHQRRLAHAEGIQPVGPNLTDLRLYDFSEDEIAAIEARLEPGAGLNALQRDAVAPGGVLAGRSVLVRAPTSGGKTLVGELAMLQQRRLGRKTAVLLPQRAVVHEQASACVDAYGNVGLRVVLSTGEVTDDDDLLRRNAYDVAFFTYEKFAAMVAVYPAMLERIGVVVFDELHMIEDASRGRTLELLLLRLRRQQKAAEWPQLVVLCGELDDLSRFQEWLGLHPVGPGERPVPLVEGVLDPQGRWRASDRVAGSEWTEQTPGFPPPRLGAATRTPEVLRAEMAVALVKTLLARGDRVLVFASTRDRVLRVARLLSTNAGLPPADGVVRALEALPSEDRHRVGAALLQAARAGVGIHIGDLDITERRIVEDAFRTGTLRAVVATTTLAMGVNSKTDAVIIVDSTLYDAEENDDRPLRRTEYRNMAGRAGRQVPGGPTRGTAHLLADSPADATALWDRYFVQPPAGLRSQLGRLAREDLALRLLLDRGLAGPADLVNDVSDTFWAFLARRDDATWERGVRRDIDDVLQTLVRDGFVELAPAPRVRLTPLGRVAAAYGIHAESVRRLVAAITAIVAARESLDELALLALAQVSVELDDVRMPRGTTPLPAPGQRGPFNTRAATYAALVRRIGLPPEDAEKLLGNRWHRTRGLTAWQEGWPLSKLEKAYVRSGSASDEPALGRLRAAAERTADLLPVVAAVARVVAPDETGHLRDLVRGLRAQLAAGGSSSAGRLLELRVGLSRHECLALAGDFGIGDEAALLEALEARRGELEARLSTPRVLAVEAQLHARRGRRRAADDNQLLLDFFNTLPGT